MSLRIHGLLVVLTVALFGPAGLRAAEPGKLVYAVPAAVPAAIPYIAFDKGYFKEEGLDVEAKMFSSGREALAALLAGQAQIQSVSETPVVHAIIQGNKLVTVAEIAELQEAKLIARKDRGILKPEDVRGKKVATLPGTNSDYFMYRFLKKYGIKPEEVKIANMSPPEMVVAYVKGDIDGYFAWEPHINYGRRQLPDQSVVFYPGELYKGRGTLNMDPDFVAKNPQTVGKILRALLKAQDFIAKHPDEAAALVARRLNMDKQVVGDLFKESVFKVELDAYLPAVEQEIGAWVLLQSKSAKSLPDFKKYIYKEALLKEKPSAVGL